MANRTIVCEDKCATVTGPLTRWSDRALQFLARSQCVLDRGLVVKWHRFARNRARLRPLQCRTILEVWIWRERVVAWRMRHLGQELKIGACRVRSQQPTRTDRYDQHREQKGVEDHLSHQSPSSPICSSTWTAWSPSNIL